MIFIVTTAILGILSKSIIIILGAEGSLLGYGINRTAAISGSLVTGVLARHIGG